jgi:hypothetical protein
LRPARGRVQMITSILDAPRVRKLGHWSRCGFGGRLPGYPLTGPDSNNCLHTVSVSGRFYCSVFGDPGVSRVYDVRGCSVVALPRSSKGVNMSARRGGSLRKHELNLRPDLPVRTALRVEDPLGLSTARGLAWESLLAIRTRRVFPPRGHPYLPSTISVSVSQTPTTIAFRRIEPLLTSSSGTSSGRALRGLHSSTVMVFIAAFLEFAGELCVRFPRLQKVA